MVERGGCVAGKPGQIRVAFFSPMLRHRPPRRCRDGRQDSMRETPFREKPEGGDASLLGGQRRQAEREWPGPYCNHTR